MLKRVLKRGQVQFRRDTINGFWQVARASRGVDAGNHGQDAHATRPPRVGDSEADPSPRTLRFVVSPTLHKNTPTLFKRRERRDAEGAPRMYRRWFTRGKGEASRNSFSNMLNATSASSPNQASTRVSGPRTKLLLV